MSIRWCPEEITKAGSARSSARRNLQLSETLLDRPDRPAILRAQRLDGLARLVDRADVAELEGSSLSRLEPPQRKPLCSADIRAIGVDSAASLLVEERARTFGMCFASDEKVGVPVTNEIGLRVENRQVIDAT